MPAKYKIPNLDRWIDKIHKFLSLFPRRGIQTHPDDLSLLFFLLQGRCNIAVCTENVLRILLRLDSGKSLDMFAKRRLNALVAFVFGQDVDISAAG